MSTYTGKFRKIGNSFGIILSKEASQMLQASESEMVIFTEAKDGLRITSYDPNFEKKMKAADSIISRYKNALKQLAK